MSGDKIFNTMDIAFTISHEILGFETLREMQSTNATIKDYKLMYDAIVRRHKILERKYASLLSRKHKSNHGNVTPPLRHSKQRHSKGRFYTKT